MLIRPLREEEKDIYNQVVDHPLQSWEWGAFRKQTGLQVERVGFFDKGKLKRGLTATFHHVPVFNKTAGYVPKGFMPDEEQLSALKQIAQKHDSIFIKLEPNIAEKVGALSAHHQVADFLLKNGAKAGRPLFTKYTFVIDLDKSEDELFANLSNKTRYNVNVAHRKGVKIVEDTSQNGLDHYLHILGATTKRQQFYAHSPQYFQTMWDTLGDSGMMRIFHALYEGKVLVTWIVFVFNKVLYYPYGASLRENRDVMASNLMMWEMIRFGKEEGCHSFDLWGSLGPKPKHNHPWFGFHRFKKGYGGELRETIGTYDLVTNKTLYPFFRIAENLRWKFLRLKARLSL